jgi:hypothetical protein
MLPETVTRARRTGVFGTYNAVATFAGSFGALAAGAAVEFRPLTRYDVVGGYIVEPSASSDPIGAQP